MPWKCLICVITFILSSVFPQEIRRKTVHYVPCDIGWQHFRQKCYKLGGVTYQFLKSWQEAANICTKYGGHLVSIHSKEELDFLVNNILMPFKYALWIGLHEREYVYWWQDGSPVNYTNWMQGEPNNQVKNEDCVLMLYNLPHIEDNIIGQWNDVVCSLNYSYICQKEILYPPMINDESSTTSENLPSKPGNLSLEAGIGVAVTFILVLLILAAGIYKFRTWDKHHCTAQHFRRSIPPPIPTSKRPKLHIQPISAAQEDTYCKLIKRRDSQRFEQVSQNEKSLPQTPVYLSTSNISQQNTKREFNEQEDPNSYEQMDLPKHWDNHRMELNMDKSKSLFQSLPQSSTDNHQMHRTQEDDNHYEPMGCYQQGDVKNLGQMLPKVKSLPRILPQPSTNGIPMQNLKKVFFQQEDNSYELMGFFESSNDKSKSLSQIPTDLSSENHLMNNTQEDDNNHYEPMGCFKHGYIQNFEQIHLNLKSLPSILAQPSTNDIPNQNLEKGFFQHEDNSYELMGFSESSSEKAKSLFQIPTELSSENQPINSSQDDNNYYDPMDCFKGGNIQNFEQIRQNLKSLPSILAQPSTNDILNKNSEKGFFQQEDNSYELMGFSESSSDKIKSLSQIPTDLPSENQLMNSIQEGDNNHYEPMGCFQRGDIQNFEQIHQNSKSLPSILAQPSTNDVPNQNSEKGFFQQEDNSYELMDSLESSSNKIKSLSQIPTDLPSENQLMDSTQKDDNNHYEPMGCFEREDVRNLDQMLQNSRNLPQISAHSFTNDVLNQNSKKEFFEQEKDNSSFSESSSYNTKPLSQTPTDSSTDNQLMHRTQLGNNIYEPMGYIEPRDNSGIEERAENAMSEILIHRSTNSPSNEWLQTDLPLQEDENAYESMC